jgi:hypothetical protein
MCLLKRDQKDTNCGHDECKNFYAMNKQYCVYAMNKPQNPISLLANPGILLQNQNQPPRQFQQQVISSGANVSPSLNTKRPSAYQEPSGAEEEEIGMLNKKKIKAKEEKVTNEVPQSQLTVNDIPLNYQNLSMFNQQLNPMMNQNMFNPPLFNSLLLNPNQQTITKIENQGPQLGDLMTILQTSQPNNIYAGLNAAAQQQGAFQLGQFMTPNTKPKMDQLGALQDAMNDENNKPKIEHTAGCEAFMREFQSKTLSLLYNQNKMLSDLKERNSMVQDTLACLISEINTIKTTVSQIVTEKGSTASTSVVLHQALANSSDTVGVETLMSYLYGPKPDFKYSIVLKNDLPLPLYRERNFKFTVMLVDTQGNVVENSNKIPLTIGIYSSENPPKYIDANTAGNKILKGFIEKDLVNGSATFDKIQIKEVTSHFRNGWIFFVVYPKVNKNSNVLLSGTNVVVNSQQIKPLIIEKVIVKAKKTKEKDQGDEGSPNSGYNQEGIKEDIYE